jgi:hypothetical protein
LKCLADQRWRLDNLYHIKNPQGKKTLFKLNWAQQELYDSLHTSEIVLKCRQIGITTFFSLLLLDNVLWKDDIQAGIIAHTLDDSQSIFQDKLKYAFDNLHPAIRPLFKTKGDSAKELSFSHGSVIRVGTSLRGSTLQYLHISEFGKICAKYPERATEIITGSLQTVHAGQYTFIESTAEGKQGYFYEMCEQAKAKVGQRLSPIDYKFRFFPWQRHPDYILDHPVDINELLQEYFAKLELEGIKLSDQQKWWYAAKYQTLKNEIWREYPSKPEEAFQASQEGFWYAKQMKELYDAGHVMNISYDRALPVHTAWDLGQADMTAIWFFQINRAGEINLIDYFQKSDFPLSQLAQMLQSKGYTYGTHLWPHDANARDRAGITFVQQARAFNLNGVVLEIHGIQQGINLVRETLGKCWFDAKKCHQGIIALENYKKRWSSAIGGFTSEEVHDESSHGAASFRYLCSGLGKIQGSKNLENDMKAVRAYWG